MPDNLLGSEYYKNTAVNTVPKRLLRPKAITDEKNGVEDPSKVSLAVSFSSVAGCLKTEACRRKLRQADSFHHIQPAEGGSRHGLFRYLSKSLYHLYNRKGKDIFLWYEDARSVRDKAQLARLFGVNGISLWRLGIIPNYSDEGLFYDVMEAVGE
jgi:hypothetical protein